MNYKIVVDSCCDLTEELKADSHFQGIPLMSVDDYRIVDDETFDQADFLRRVAASPNSPKSTCPSPEQYMSAFDCEAGHVYAVTLSSQLSGSYNSAEIGRKLYLEEKGQKQIHVFDSRSASVGETLIAMKIAECEEQGMEFAQVVETVEAYIDGQNTYFVLETLDTLRKNGRLKGVKAVVATALNIKPVMGATPDGLICQLGQAQGMNKALERMVKEIMQRTKDREERILGIAHCNCLKRAQKVKEQIEKLMREYIYNIGCSAQISAEYMIRRILEKAEKRKAQKTE